MRALASSIDKQLSSNFIDIFHRSPSEDDSIEVVDLSFGFAMCLALRPDEYQVFAFVQDSKVYSVSDFGYSHYVYYCPLTQSFY